MTPQATDDKAGTLREGEYHPAANGAMAYLRAFGMDLLPYQEAFASCAIEGNRLGEICSETLRRVLAGEPVSDRYLLGLAWSIRNMVEMKNE